MTLLVELKDGGFVCASKIESVVREVVYPYPENPRGSNTTGFAVVTTVSGKKHVTKDTFDRIVPYLGEVIVR